MMTIGELAERRYLRLLVGLTMLDCQRNCNIINRLEIDNIVIVKTLEKIWLNVLKQMDTITLIQYVLCIWYILLYLSNKYTIHLLTIMCSL